jgi:hypothetical protein
MRASRFTRCVPIACMAVAAWAGPRDARGQACAENDTVRVTLSKTDTGKDKIVDGCWMPSVATASKVLCAHDIKREHTFTFALENQCDIDVRLELTVTRGSIKMRRPDNDPPDHECNDGASKFLFAGYLSANSGPQVPKCSTKPHWKWPIKWSRTGSYALVATHVRQNGVETKLQKPVNFDPEIIIEDNGKGFVGFGVIALLVAGLLYAIYRWLRRS